MPSESDRRPPVPNAAVVAILDRLDARIAAHTHDGGPASAKATNRRPDEPLGPLRHNVVRFLSLASRVIRENRTFTETELRPVREGAVQAAVDGAQLAAVLRNWHRLIRTFLDECRAVACGERAVGLVEIAAAAVRLQEVLTCVVVEAYEAERVALDGDSRPTKELLARLLLAGQDAGPAARWCGVELEEMYSVVALDYSDHDRSGRRGDPGAQWSAETRVARVLDRLGPPAVLSVLGSGGGTLLVPFKGSGDADWFRTGDEVAEAISVALESPVRGVVLEPAAPPGLPESGGLATDLLTLAGRIGCGPGVYRIDDLALPYQLSQSTAGQRHLDDRLVPLDPYPELVETLDVYLHHDLDRTRTARALDVHPNTVNNRLVRIRSLVGVDPSCYEGIMTLGAALDARRAWGRRPAAPR